MARFSVDGIVGRSVRAMATSRGFRVVGPKVVPAADRFLNKITGGRVLLSRAMMPSLVLTATGRRSGQPRVVPLACLPVDGGVGGWYVVGSNFGRDSHPAWTENLLSEPRAHVSHGQRDVDVTARLLDPVEKEEVWPRLLEIWPAYDDYAEISGREIRVFHLNPDPQA